MHIRRRNVSGRELPPSRWRQCINKLGSSLPSADDRHTRAFMRNVIAVGGRGAEGRLIQRFRPETRNASGQWLVCPGGTAKMWRACRITFAPTVTSGRVPSPALEDESCSLQHRFHAAIAFVPHRIIPRRSCTCRSPRPHYHDLVPSHYQSRF